MGAIFWAPAMVNRYETRSGYGPEFVNCLSMAAPLYINAHYVKNQPADCFTKSACHWSLTHFMPLVSLFIRTKNIRKPVFLIFLGGIQRSKCVNA